MIISYDNLWKLLIDKKLNKTELARKTNISSSTIAKMTHGEPVAMTVLARICDELDCDVGDIMTNQRFIRNISSRSISQRCEQCFMQYRKG